MPVVVHGDRDHSLVRCCRGWAPFVTRPGERWQWSCLMSDPGGMAGGATERIWRTAPGSRGSVGVVRGLFKLLALMAWVSIRSFCRLAVRGVDVQVRGLEHVPRSGPVILAARHYHYTYDGIAIYALVGRQLRAVAALDWLPPGH